VPGAGMVAVSLRDGEHELLGRRQGLGAYVHDGKTMGIPLLHPWANRLATDRFTVAGQTIDLSGSTGLVHRDSEGLPIHGLLAGFGGWQVISRNAGQLSADLSARLDLGAEPGLMALFPFPHRLRIDVSVAEGSIAVHTTLTATGELPVPVAFGFHPYLRLFGAPRESFEIELPTMRRLEVDEEGIPTGAARPVAAASRQLGTDAIDDAFADLWPDSEFAVSGAGWRIAVRFERGFPAAQVYAPTDDPVICFEPMTAPTNALVSGDRLRFCAPGQSYVASFSIEAQTDR
jgi:aldose 1-epimerase